MITKFSLLVLCLLLLSLFVAVMIRESVITLAKKILKTVFWLFKPVTEKGEYQRINSFLVHYRE